MAKGPRYQVFSVSDDEKPWAVRDTKDKNRLIKRFWRLERAVDEAQRLNKESKRK